MGVGRKFAKEPRTRPRKTDGERRRRETSQRKRLVGLGMDELAVRKLNSEELRNSLRCRMRATGLS